ncbi:MAG: hypothetical protein F4X44_03755 [Gammaproteobacteria bacterium]|nr:hypothetical protein [Gammaproteobacteria bacterium]
MRNSQTITIVGICAMLGLSGCVYINVNRTQDSNDEVPRTSTQAESAVTGYVSEEGQQNIPPNTMNEVSERGNQATMNTESDSTSTIRNEQTFSFLNPDTFHLADKKQRETLKGIYESEFDLSHLSQDDQNILSEALSKSGIEVQSVCVVNKETTAKIGAFFRNWNMIQLTKYHPPSQDHPYSHLVEETEESEKNGQPTTRRSYSQGATDYPYPLSEANAVIKLVPINLSTTKVLERTENSVTYEADPSKLLFVNLREEDQLWDTDDSRVVFNIDVQRNRLNWLKYELKESVKVHTFVRISDFQLSYEFVEDERLNRNVVRSVDHSMKGRLALLFRPNLKISNSFSYDTCSSAPPTESYLFQSMSAIANL